MGNNGKNQFLLFDYYIMLLVTQTFRLFQKKIDYWRDGTMVGRNGEISFWRWYYFNSNIFITDYFDVENTYNLSISGKENINKTKRWILRFILNREKKVVINLLNFALKL